ncbi:MAG: DUF748 domain-containing protein [Opitutaceae bacterium]|jgi:hypothetical protein
MSPRLRRWLIAAAAAFVLFSIAGFFVLPPIIKSQAEKRLSAELGRTVTIGNVRVNPYMLSIALEDFDIKEKDGQGSFLGWKRLYVRFDALPSIFGEWVLGDIELGGFHAGVVVNPDGSLNFSDLLAKIPPPSPDSSAQPAKASRPVRVGSLSVTEARVDFSDHSRAHPFTSAIGPLTFTLSEFRTVGDRSAPYHFEAVTEAGEKVAWTGTLLANPLKSEGQFSLENIVLKKYAPYFEDRVRADLTDGKLTFVGRYEASLDPKQRVLRLQDGQLFVRGLQVNERAKGLSAIELPALDVTGLQADAVAMKAAVGAVTLAGGHLSVRREKDGSINLLSMLQPDASPAPAAPAAAAPLPDVTVGEFALKDFKVDVSDLAAPRPARLSLGDIQFSLKNVTLADGAAMPLQLSFAWAPRGTVHVAGSVTLKPSPAADLKTEVTELDVLPLSPYLEQFVNARIAQGTVSTANAVQMTMAGGQPSLNFAGDIKVEKLGLVDGVKSEDLAGFTSLSLTGLKIATAPQLSVSLAEVNVTEPYARVVVSADKSINLTAVANTGEPAPVRIQAGPAPAGPLPKITIGRVLLAGGYFSFADQSVQPNVHIALSQFGGTISGLSSENLARADVDLKGAVDGAGPVTITGKLDPLGASKFVDLKLAVRNVDLLPFSPYSGKFAGYELARGKLLVDANFHLAGQAIDATNVVTVEQFTFGAATKSPDATGLPVRLGVALLKDLDGKIVIDLPVQGSLNDPNFRIGKVVLRVIVNLLTKAAVSPFSLIGSMFGGGGEELSFQEFAPGSSELQPAELPKLGTIVKALANRPGLSLGIEGSYDAAADTYALKRQKLAELVRHRIWEDRHAADPNIQPPDQLVIAPEDSAAMIKKIFDEKFPPGTQFGTPLPPPPAVAPPPPAPPPGILKRILNAFTADDERRRQAAEEERARLIAEHEKAVAAAIATGLPLEEMTGRLADSMEVTADDLRAQAAARAARVRDYLIGTGHIAADRLFLAQGADASKLNKGPRVFLSLQ